MTAQSPKEQIIALIEKKGFIEQSMKKDLYITTFGETKVGIDLVGEKPVVGVFINNILREEGHGNLKVDELRDKILYLWERETDKEKKEIPAPKEEPKETKKKQVSTPNPLDNATHLNDDMNTLCGYQHSTSGRCILTTLRSDVTCPHCLEEIRRNDAVIKQKEIPKRNLIEELKSEPKTELEPLTSYKPDARIPIKATSPQGNYIKGLVPMMKEIGKIKIGSKGEVKTSQKGTQYRPPVKFDHFEIVSVFRDEKSNLIPDPIMKELSEKPKELDIFLLYNDETLNFSTRYNEYKGGKCMCSGDGVKARLINGDEKECNPETCDVFQAKRCKPNGILSVILAKSPRLGGVYKFRTTSHNSIRSILSSLFFIKSLTGGVLAMIPLKLTVSPMTVQPINSMTAQTIYVVNVEFAGTVQELLEKTVEVSKYQSHMRANIQQLEATARAALTAPESEEEMKDVEAEFYPEREATK